MRSQQTAITTTNLSFSISLSISGTTFRVHTIPQASTIYPNTLQSAPLAAGSQTATLVFGFDYRIAAVTGTSITMSLAMQDVSTGVFRVRFVVCSVFEP